MHFATVEERSGDLSDEIRREALVAGRDGRVDREHAVAPDAIPGGLQVDPAGDELAGSFGEQERRVTFVQVPDRRIDPERARSARTPPTPRTSSWWRRISRPRTYRM